MERDFVQHRFVLTGIVDGKLGRWTVACFHPGARAESQRIIAGIMRSLLANGANGLRLTLETHFTENGAPGIDVQNLPRDEFAFGPEAPLG